MDNISRAQKAADWMARNQVLGDPFDANQGRLLAWKSTMTGAFELSTNWLTGFASMVFQSMYSLTSEDRYLNHKRAALNYLKSLQILDSRVPRNFGAFREETPQTERCHPRDGVSAAWAFLCDYYFTRNRDSIERAELFANWLLTYGMRDDWPLCTVPLTDSVHCAPDGSMDATPTDELEGSFQSGGILFFLDLFKVTQNIRYYDAAYRMSAFYVDHFFAESGEIVTLIDTHGNNSSMYDTEKWNPDWRKMHKVNDDFGGIALRAAYHVFHKNRYLSRLKGLFRWLAKTEHPDGGFFRPEIEVGTSCVLIFLETFIPIAGELKAEAESMKQRLTDHLYTLQFHSDDPSLDGAFYGLSDQHAVGNKEWVNLRNTAYSIFALLAETGKSAFPIPHTGYFVRPSTAAE